MYMYRYINIEIKKKRLGTGYQESSFITDNQ